jgi:CRISPR/Cas system-associated protein Cas10 (large subunit of type III CRISPR-Cas system)
VEEADQVEEVQEEVSYHHNLRSLGAHEQDEADHQVAEEEEDQDAEHQEEEEEGDSREWEWKRKSYTLTGTDIIAVNIMQTATRVRV